MSGNTPSAAAWQLLRAALDEPPEARVAFVQASGAPPQVRDEALALLAADAGADSLLDVPLDPQRILGGADDALLGSVIGGYRLQGELGRGGMGAVYRAERVGGVPGHRVALKLIKRGMDSDEIVRRFLREREILAQLRHPHVAQLADGGVSQSGQVWFAMELIEGGEPITHWCDARRASIAQRIALFLDVCAAVQHAHRNLVVHRDLKPGNILVDAQGVVKLLDFGIAKLLDEGGMDSTRSQLKLLTPEYAAPEQHQGAAISTATDVYQLGLVLFELLSGRRAWRADSDPTAEPPRLLAATGERDPAALEAIAGARGTHASALRRVLGGDLERIVRKALNPDPLRRYEGAANFADDLRRYLDGRPVLARPDSATYRARKFVARHLAATIATVAIALALIFASLYSAHAAALARADARRAQAVREFLLDLFALNRPERRDGVPLGARELVDLGARRASAALSGDPDTRVELLGTVGGLYHALGDFDRAAAVHKERLEAAQALYAGDDVRIARARVASAVDELELDHTESADKLAREALAMLPATDTASRADRADALDAVAMVDAHRGRLTESIAAMYERLALLRALDHTHDAQIAAMLAQLGALQSRVGRVAQGNESLDAALAALKDAGEEGPAGLIATRNNLIEVLTERGRLDDAGNVADANLELVRHIYGDAHVDVAFALFQKAQIERMRGAPRSAIPLYRQALDIYQRVLGPNHSYVATMLTSLAQALSQDSQAAEAIGSLEKARDVYVATLGPNHLFTATATSALAKARLADGDARGAESDYRDALARFAASPDPQHIYIEAAHVGLGSALVAQRRYDEAQPLLRAANARLTERFGSTDFRAVDATIALARCVAGLGKRDDAKQLLAATRAELARTPEKSAALLAKVDAASAALDAR